MTTVSITKRVEFRWKVLGNYYITKDGKVYNSKTGKEKMRTVKNSTIGYWIGRKFYSLAALNKMAEKIAPIKCPF